MMFMHGFASFISMLREIVRPGVIWFFRDTNDPDFHPLKQMLETPISRYCRRLTLIAVMYGFLITMMSWLPVKNAIAFSPGLLPFKFVLTHPMEFLLLNLGLPLVHDQLQLTATATRAVTKWIEVASYILGTPPSSGDIPPFEPTVSVVRGSFGHQVIYSIQIPYSVVWIVSVTLKRNHKKYFS